MKEKRNKNKTTLVYNFNVFKKVRNAEKTLIKARRNAWNNGDKTMYQHLSNQLAGFSQCKKIFELQLSTQE